MHDIKSWPDNDEVGGMVLKRRQKETMKNRWSKRKIRKLECLITDTNG